jgi:dTDP-4-dehydrorhamnose reductase
MLGKALVEVLSRDHQVSGADIEEADIRLQGESENLVSMVKPELVIHAAANTDVDGCELDEKAAYLSNGIGTRNIGLACAKVNAVCMFISTDFVFDGEKKDAYDELDDPNPINTYGRSKYMGEVLLSSVLIRHYILRTEWLYGTGGKNFVDQIIKKAREDGQLRVVTDQVGSPTNTLDLAEMIANMIKQLPPFGVYHLTNGGSCSWYEFAKAILSLVGLSDIPVNPVSQEAIGRPARRPHNSVMKNLMYELQGFTPARHWKDALVDYIRRVYGDQPNLMSTAIEDSERRPVR